MVSTKNSSAAFEGLEVEVAGGLVIPQMPLGLGQLVGGPKCLNIIGTEPSTPGLIPGLGQLECRTVLPAHYEVPGGVAGGVAQVGVRARSGIGSE